VDWVRRRTKAPTRRTTISIRTPLKASKGRKEQSLLIAPHKSESEKQIERSLTFAGDA